MKVIICGGRDYAFSDTDIHALHALHAYWRFSLVLSGAASGADAGGEAWAASVGIPVRRYPAEWHRYGRAAGPRRNHAMIECCAALPAGIVVAFPGGRGTRNCLQIALAAGLQVVYARRRVENVTL